MNAAQQFLARLTEVEKIRIRAASASESSIIGLYNDYKAELPGGNLLGGTQAEGVEAMRQVHTSLSETYAERSKLTGFGQTWLL